jgi:WD40 repeat protein
LSRIKAQKLCERLSGLSLLLRFDLATRTIRLHDVMRSYLARELRDPAAVHAALLDAWGDPHHLPDDYAWRRYAWHLKQAGREKALRKLLLDFNWLQAKLAATDVTALISDYDHAAVRLRHSGRTDTALPGKPIGIPPWRYAPCVGPADVAASSSRQGGVAAGSPRHGGVAASSSRHLPSPQSLAPSPFSLVQGALRLSAHVLAADKTQLASQLVGRLAGYSLPEIRVVLDQAQRSQAGPWLKAEISGLTPSGGPLLRTLEGHSDGVNAVAVTPDGGQAISGSADKTLKVWDLKRGQLVRRLEGHIGGVNAVAVTPDGGQVILGSEDKALKVWDLKTGKLVRTLEGHSGLVYAVAGTPDGGQAISGSYDNTVKVWDLKAGQVVRTLEGHSDWVRAVAVTPDGGRAISGSGDETLKVWDLKTGKVARTLEGHRGGVEAVAVTPDSGQPISGSSDNTLKVWDLKTGKVVWTPEGHSDGVCAVAVTPEGGQAISASDDHTLKVWDLDSGRCLATFTAEYPIYCCAVARDGVTIVAGDESGAVHFLTLEMPGASQASPQGSPRRR